MPVKPIRPFSSLIILSVEEAVGIADEVDDSNPADNPSREKGGTLMKCLFHKQHFIGFVILSGLDVTEVNSAA